MKLIIPAALVLIGLVATGIIKTGNNLVDGLKFQIDPLRSLKDFSISKGMMELPVAVNIINSTETGLLIDSLFASLYKKDGNEWSFIGSTQPNLTNKLIKPRATTPLNFLVKVPLVAAGQEVFAYAMNFLSNNTMPKPKTNYKVEVRIGVEGQTFTQNFEQSV